MIALLIILYLLFGFLIGMRAVRQGLLDSTEIWLMIFLWPIGYLLALYAMLVIWVDENKWE